MIQENPVFDLLDLQIYAQTGGFIMGVNKFGDNFGDGTDTQEWISYACDVLSTNVVRGGARDGLTNSIDVGSLSMLIKNNADPLTDIKIRPNTPIRLILKNDDETVLFTGKILDVKATYALNKKTGVKTRFVSIYSVDAVQNIANTKRYGADDGIDGFEKWEERIERLSLSTDQNVNLPVEGTPTVKYQYDYYDFDPTPSGDGLDSWVRFGTYPSGVTGTIEQAAVSGSFPGQSMGVRVQSSNGFAFPITLAADTYGARRTIAGLTPGKTYTLNMGLAYQDPTSVYALGSVNSAEHFSKYKIGVTGIGHSAEVDLRTGSIVGDKYLNAMPEFSFVATSTSHQIEYILSTGNTRTVASTNPILESVLGYNVEVATEVSISPYRLQSIVYESNLANHFNVACDSVGAFWWVDQNNEIQFKADLDNEGITATFTDDPNDLDALCYTNIITGYDTKNTVNDIELVNHGLQDDPFNPGNNIANDVVYSFVDPTSIAGYSHHSDEIHTSLWTGTGYELSIEQRAEELLIEHRRPKQTITQITWNAQENPEKLAALEIYNQIQVNFEGKSQLSRIVGLAYDIQPTRWMVIISLAPEKGYSLETIPE